MLFCAFGFYFFIFTLQCLYVGIEHGIRFDLHLTCMISGKRDFLRFFAGYKEMINEKQKHPQTRMNTGFTGVCTLSLQVDLDAVFKHLLIFCDSIYIVFIHKFCLNFFKIN